MIINVSLDPSSTIVQHVVAVRAVADNAADYVLRQLI